MREIAFMWPAAGARAAQSLLMEPQQWLHLLAATGSEQHKQKSSSSSSSSSGSSLDSYSRRKGHGPACWDRDGSSTGTPKEEDLGLRQRAGHGGEESSRKKESKEQQAGALQAEEGLPRAGGEGPLPGSRASSPRRCMPSSFRAMAHRVQCLMLSLLCGRL